MKNSFSFIKDGGWLTMTIAVIAGVLLVVGGVQAATTISNDIVTAGSVTLGDTVADIVTANGYFTQLRIGTGSTFDDIAAVGADELGVEGAMEVDGAAYFDGAVDMDSTLTIAGVASTSALKVGDEPAAPTINGLVFGYCSFADVTSFVASTTRYVDCTTIPASALVAGDRVFVQATSSLDTGFIVEAASTTAVSTINLRILNTSIQLVDTTLGGTSINFWAVR